MNPTQTIRYAINTYCPEALDALAALAELERTHYTPADMADASAKGFRDGVASVTAGQEPVAWCPALTYPGYEKDRAWANGKPRKEDIEYWTLNGKGITYAYAAPVAQQPQARPDFTDEWTGYLKDGETPFERFLRERKDLNALTKLYQRALEENERLKAQQPQAEAAPMSQPNRLIAYSAAAKLRELGYQWDEEAEAWAPQQAEAVPQKGGV